MDNQNSNIYIIIPAYNEEKNLPQVLADLLKLVPREACGERSRTIKGYDYQIVVVDDGSTDNTFQTAKQFPICVLHHQINRGQGAALATGSQYALQQGADIIVHFDGDGQFLAREIENVVAPILSQGIDIVLGSRFYADKCGFSTRINADNRIPFLKKYVILPVAKIINYFLTGIKLTDAHCGFRAMNRLAAERIKISQDGMSHNTEVVAQIKKYHLKHQEVPITVIYHEFGQGVGGGFRILKELFLGKIIKN